MAWQKMLFRRGGAKRNSEKNNEQMRGEKLACTNNTNLANTCVLTVRDRCRFNRIFNNTQSETEQGREREIGSEEGK